jgi:hypothetical protein
MLAAAAGAHAATFSAAPNMTFTLSPTTKDGYFSTWSTTDLKGLSALRTEARFVGFGDDPKWIPAYKIAFDAGKQHIMLSVGALRDGRLQIDLEDWRDKTLAKRDTFALAPGARATLEIELYWDPDGRVTAIVGAGGLADPETRAAKLEVPLEKVSIYVSTGSVDFNPVMLGSGRP